MHPHVWARHLPDTLVFDREYLHTGLLTKPALLNHDMERKLLILAMAPCVCGSRHACIRLACIASHNTSSGSKLTRWEDRSAIDLSGPSSSSSHGLCSICLSVLSFTGSTDTLC